MTASPRDILVGLLLSGYPALKRRLAARLGSAELANEALQDTYIRLQRTDIQGELRNPRSYLFRMALNIASNRIRAEKRHLSAMEIETLIDLADETPDALRIAEARSELVAIDQALQKLSPRRRAMFRSFWIDHATYKDIALDHDISERTVRHELLLATRHLHHATQKFSVAELQNRLAQVSSQQGP